MRRISKYAALLAAVAGLLVMGCDSGNGGGNEPSSPLTVTNGTVISCDKTAKGTVEIPDGVTAIGDYAFSGCTGLTDVSIPSGVKSVGQNAFAGCYGLTVRYAGTKEQWEKLGVNTENITVVCRDGTVGESDEGQGENPVTYYTVTFYPNVPQNAGSAGLSPVMREYAAGSGQHIPDDLFVLDGYRLVGWATNAGGSTVSCPIGSSFTVFENRDFYAVWEAVVDIPTNGLVIKDNIVVEYRSDSGVTAVAIPYGVTGIGSSAFAGCSDLVSVEIPASVTSIGSGAFSGCSSLTIHYNGTRSQWESLRIETYGVPVVCTDDGQGSENQPSVLTIQNRVVVKCDPSATGYIEIQPGVTEIAAGAFNNCISIKGVVIPDGVTSIGSGAFRYCSDMLSVEIPGSVTYIGDRAFEYCNRLEEVNFTGTVSQLAALGLDTRGIKDMGTVSVTVNYGKPGQGPGHFVDSGDSTLTGYVIIPSGVTEIKENAFKSCSDLLGVGISNGVTSIGVVAFQFCLNLTECAIPSSVTTIEREAFYQCESLLSIEIPNSVTSIMNSAFKFSGLASVAIPKSVTEFGSEVFTACSNLASVTIPDGMVRVGDEMFSRCNSLISVSIPSSVLSIKGRMFDECSNLASVTIFGGVTSIGSYTFQGCRSLTNVTIPATMTSIGTGAFYGCGSLATVKYGGTQAQWKCITKNEGWDSNTGNYIVYCTDGTIAK